MSESRDETPPSKYTSKLNDLLAFLEAADTDTYKENDNPSSETAVAGLSPSSASGGKVGLADVSNRRPAASQRGASEGKEAVAKALKGVAGRVDSPSKTRVTKPLVRREKRSSFIWEDWEECSFLATLDSLDDSCDDKENEAEKPKAAPTADAEKSATGLPPDAQQQLEALKSMSEEITTRAANMKVELEQKTKIVDDLNSVRVKNEAEHVQKMKAAKQEWKHRLDFAQAKHDKAMDEQTKLRESLLTECDALEKTISTTHTDAEKTNKSEKEICKRLKRDGQQDLEQAKMAWAQAEKSELNARDKRMSPKLKKDAAKRIEPKLKQLMEGQKEELERLEREAARELDCYKLELYKLSNEEYKKETNKIRAGERKRVEKVEQEWLHKLECSRRDCEAEVQRVRSEHEQRAKCMQQQFNADAQQYKDEHQASLEDAKKAEALELDQARLRHEREMAALDDEYSAKVVERRKSCKVELKEWKASRETELLREEEQKVEADHVKLKGKVQAEIDVVKHKLEEEKLEKIHKKQLQAAEKNGALKDRHDAEIQRLKHKFAQAKKETDLLLQREAEEDYRVEELRNKLAKLKESLCDNEDQIIIQERRLASFLEECDRQSEDIQRDGERKFVRAKNEHATMEKELHRLISDQPKQQEQWTSELEGLAASNAEEINVAEQTISAMLESKQSMLEAASSRLLRLRQDTVEVERQLDDARKAKVLGHK